MLLLKLLIFTLTLCEYIINSDGVTSCPKGQKLSLSGRCEACPDGSYQPEINHSQQCKPCTFCEDARGSSIKLECTKTADRICECKKGFVPLESDASTCKCDPGFGMKNGACVICEDGYFNNRINSLCQKWKECKSGVNITGSRTSDVICNDLTDSDTTTTFIAQLTSHSPREETQTQTIRTMATTTATPQYRVTKKVVPSSPSSTGNYIGMALLMFGITGLLILTAVTCKLHITPCVQRTAVQTKDSCRRPVEESGNSRSSLKLNPEEP